MQVTIAKVHENLFAGEAVSLTAPTAAGEVTILSKHEALVTTLKPGTITVRLPAQAGTASVEKAFTVEAGVLEVSHDQVTVLL
jgi:F0F1-type ATP synthase epsilon subunit